MDSRIRAARTLVFSREGGAIVGFNYLTKSVFSCSADLLTFLSLIDDWTPLGDLGRHLPSLPDDELRQTVDRLLDVNALSAEQSPLAAAEEDFHASWKWGVPAAMFHFSVLDKKLIPIEEAEAMQLAKLALGPQPQLYQRNEAGNGAVVALPEALADNDLLQLMAKRRTVRAALPVPIALEHLSDCLFAGMGITGETRNVAGTLPLSMTPSGGARNPYEAYVYAREVEGLVPGFYHYSAFDHTLERLPTDAMPRPSELIGNPDWSDGMPCLILLVANFERTWWKYDDANAYRVVLIEAGHIGQNVMLAATRHGLTACPTAALNHSNINACLGTRNRFAASPVYALALAHPGEVEEGAAAD